MDFETILRYNFNPDKEAVKTLSDKFDSVIVPSHFVAGQSSAIPQFIYNLVKEGVDYYIQPGLWQFRIGRDFLDEDNNLRKFHRKYLDELGDPVTSHFNNYSNLSADEIPPDARREISRKVARFQVDFVAEKVQRGFDKYLDDTPDEIKPKAVIPWIHKITSTDDYDTQREIVGYTKDEVDIEVRPAIFTTKDHLSRNRKLLTSFIDELNVSSVFIWIEDLKKYSTNEEQYAELARMVEEIHNGETDPYFFAGDYFSYLLSYRGLRGTAFGPMFGEELAEMTETRGPMDIPDRYYVYQLKDFLTLNNAEDVLGETDIELCDCPTCDRLLKGWGDVLDLDRLDLAKHSLHMRHMQKQYISEHTLDEALSDLETKYDELHQPYYQSNHQSPNKNIEYLIYWSSALK